MSLQDWFLKSSANPQKTALTVKGLLVGVFPLVLYALKQAGIDNPQLDSLPDQIQNLVLLFFTIVSGGTTFYGLARKFILTFRGTNHQ